MRVESALQRWGAIGATHALRAVDPTRVAAEAARAPNGPLGGLLFSVKDVFPVAGVESCAGSLVLRDNVPAVDPPLIATLRAAGAVAFGKGVCAEFGFGLDTENRLDGRVTNPVVPEISPGGSSGGDAVAVSAGVVDFAVAGDYGGSVRWPAQAVEVLGLRLGLGRAPASHRIGAPSRGQQARLEVPGVMARDVGVLGRVVTAMLGEDVLGARPRRLLLVSPDVLGPVSRPVAGAIEDMIREAELSGFEVLDGPPALAAAIVDAFDVYRRLRELTDHHEGVRAVTAGKEDLLCASTVAVLEAAAASTRSADLHEVHDLESRAQEISADVDALLEGASALLLPVSASGAIGFDEQVTIAGARHDATSLHRHLRAVSLTGLPALALPVGDMVSVQLVGPSTGEHLLARIAGELRR